MSLFPQPFVDDCRKVIADIGIGRQATLFKRSHSLSASYKPWLAAQRHRRLDVAQRIPYSGDVLQADVVTTGNVFEKTGRRFATAAAVFRSMGAHENCIQMAPRLSQLAP